MFLPKYLIGQAMTEYLAITAVLTAALLTPWDGAPVVVQWWRVLRRMIHGAEIWIGSL
jgi:hypothetical protein